MQQPPKQIVWIGMAFMLMMAFVHLIAAQHAFEDAAPKGLLFVAGAICALLAATGIQEGHPIWGWGLGTLVAGVAFTGFILNTTVGLPGLVAEPSGWQEPLGLVALAAEGLMIVVALGFFATAYVAARHHIRHRMA